uniref:Ig-like domain-containing protein n=1 Tax=Meloidogyne incognita TaxID=6306 RepID=A0A914NGD4_MELIC
MLILGTEPITIKWFTPNRVEITNNHLNAYRIDRVGKDSRLTIFDAFPTDSGDYKCLAENKFGTAKCIFELKITEKNNFNYNIEQKPPTVSAKQSTIYAKQGQRFVVFNFLVVFGDETVICWYRIVQDSEQHIIPNTKKYEVSQ